VNNQESTLRKRLPLAIQSVVSIALLVLLFRSLDLAGLRHLYATMPLGFYLISLAVVIGGQALYAWRWRQVLSASGVAVTVGTAIRQYFIGIFLNNFFPSTVGGDMAKVYYLGRDHGYRPIAASIVLDRLLSIGLLAVLATAMYWIAPDPSPQFAATRVLVTAIAVFLIVGLVLAARGTGGLPQRLAPFGTLAVGLAERAQRFRHDMAAAARRPQIVFQSAAVVTTYFFALTAIYRVFLQINTTAHPAYLTLLTAVTTASLLSNIPISVNGLGLREQLHAILLAPLGVPREAAVAISLLIFAHLLVSSLIGLLFWFRLPADVKSRIPNPESQIPSEL
jgi:glycosyltransferase 2 family protein